MTQELPIHRLAHPLSQGGWDGLRQSESLSGYLSSDSRQFRSVGGGRATPRSFDSGRGVVGAAVRDRGGPEGARRLTREGSAAAEGRAATPRRSGFLKVSRCLCFAPWCRGPALPATRGRFPRGLRTEAPRGLFLRGRGSGRSWECTGRAGSQCSPRLRGSRAGRRGRRRAPGVGPGPVSGDADSQPVPDV